MPVSSPRALALEELDCDLCGGADYDVVWPEVLPPALAPDMFSYSGGKRFHGRVVRCLGCGLRYVSPRPRFTTEMYAAAEDPHYEGTRASRLRAFAPLLSHVALLAAPGDALLDLGCATGPWLAVAGNAGYRVRGVEPSHWASAVAARHGLAVDNCALEDFVTTERFRVVTCFDVLEHTDSPRRVASIAFDLLEPGGTFVVSVPDFSRWHTRVLGRYHWLVVLMHYYYFDPSTIRRLLESVGFTNVRVVPAPRVTMALADAAVWFSRWGAPGRAAARVFTHSPLGRLHVSVRASLLAIGQRPAE